MPIKLISDLTDSEKIHKNGTIICECLVLKYVDTKKGVVMDKRLKKFTIADRLSNALCCAPTSWHTTEALERLSGALSTKSVQHLSTNLGWMSTNLVQL